MCGWPSQCKALKTIKEHAVMCVYINRILSILSIPYYLVAYTTSFKNLFFLNLLGGGGSESSGHTVCNSKLYSLNKGHLGTRASVLYSEVSEVRNVLAL